MQNTEQRILDAAEKEFFKKGFAEARTTAIAEAAGVTHAMLHYYFRSKEKLFERIMSEKMSLIRDLMLASLDTSDLPLFEKVERAVSKHFDFVAANPYAPHFLIGEIYRQPERSRMLSGVMRDQISQMVATLQGDIDAAAVRGECRRVDARMLLLDMVSLNLFSFMAAPLVGELMSDLVADKERFLEMRKKENVETILRKLKP